VSFWQVEAVSLRQTDCKCDEVWHGMTKRHIPDRALLGSGNDGGPRSNRPVGSLFNKKSNVSGFFFRVERRNRFEIPIEGSGIKWMVHRCIH
jgi:hypothetical protein